MSTNIRSTKVIESSPCDTGFNFFNGVKESLKNLNVCFLDNLTGESQSSKICETLTTLSPLQLTDNVLYFTYRDERGVDNLRTIDLSSLGGGGTYTFNNGLNEVTNVARLGGTLIMETLIETNSHSFALVSDLGSFTFSTDTTTLLTDNISFPLKPDSTDNSITDPPVAFFYPNSVGDLKVAPLSFITDLVTPVDYTSSQGVSKNTLDFRLGDTAVSGTGLSANPFTSHRDITGAFRLSFKNDRVLFGSNNTQDTTTAKVKIVPVNDALGQHALLIKNSSDKLILGAENSGNVQIGFFTGNNNPFLSINSVAESFDPSYHVANSIVYFANGPVTFLSRGEGIPVIWKDGYSCNVSKHQFRVPLKALNTTPFANMLIATDTSLTHQGTDYTGVSNIAELQLSHINSDYTTTGKIPKQSSILIDGVYTMPSNYTNGEVNFVKITPTYVRSAQNALTGTTPLRGFYYAPTISLNAIPVTNEIAFESTRGSVVIGNGTEKDTLRLPSLTAAQRDTVTALATIGESNNVAKIVYNSDNKFVEYNNGLGWITQNPGTLTGSSIVWDACNTNKNLTLTANTAITNITNLVPGSTLVLAVTQDLTGGRTLSITASGFTIKTLGAISSVATETSIVTIYVSKTNELLISIIAGYV